GSCADLPPSFWGDLDSTLRLPPTVSQVERFAGDTGPLWAATGSGRLFVIYNANVANQASVTYTRVDSLASNDPERFISSIYIDPANKNNFWFCYSAYNPHTPSTPAQGFEWPSIPVARPAPGPDRTSD